MPEPEKRTPPFLVVDHSGDPAWLRPEPLQQIPNGNLVAPLDRVFARLPARDCRLLNAKLAGQLGLAQAEILPHGFEVVWCHGPYYTFRIGDFQCLSHRNFIHVAEMDSPADRLRQARIANGFVSAAEAADKHGWNKPTYYAHENGSRGIRIDAAKRYARAFRTSAQWIMTGEGKLDVYDLTAIDLVRRMNPGQRDAWLRMAEAMLGPDRPKTGTDDD